MKMHYDIVKAVAKMKPIVKFVRSRFSGPDPRLWTQQSLGPVPFAEMGPGPPPAADAVELSGSVPRPALRQAAIDVVLREVESTGRGCALQDRLAVQIGRASGRGRAEISVVA